MHWIRVALAAALLPAFGGNALAQPDPAASPPRAPRPWQVDWGTHYCTMIRHPGEGRPFSTAIVTVPGGDTAQIMLIPEGAAALPRGVTSVVLMPGARSFDVSAREEDRGGRRVVAIAGLAYDFRDQLAGAGELQLKAGDQIRARVPLADPRAAIAAHRRCTAEIAREWGVDEAALEALRRRPATTNVYGLTADDYPPAALRTATQGRVIARVAVSPEGRATECATVATSGSELIDATTCRVVLARARFRPALDAAGRPVAVRMVSTFTWLIPQ